MLFLEESVGVDQLAGELVVGFVTARVDQLPLVTLVGFPVEHVLVDAVLEQPALAQDVVDRAVAELLAVGAAFGLLVLRAAVVHVEEDQLHAVFDYLRVSGDLVEAAAQAAAQRDRAGHTRVVDEARRQFEVVLLALAQNLDRLVLQCLAQLLLELVQVVVVFAEYDGGRVAVVLDDLDYFVDELLLLALAGRLVVVGVVHDDFELVVLGLFAVPDRQVDDEILDALLDADLFLLSLRLEFGAGDAVDLRLETEQLRLAPHPHRDLDRHLPADERQLLLLAEFEALVRVADQVDVVEHRGVSLEQVALDVGVAELAQADVAVFLDLHVDVFLVGHLHVQQHALHLLVHDPARSVVGLGLHQLLLRLHLRHPLHQALRRLQQGPLLPNIQKELRHVSVRVVQADGLVLGLAQEGGAVQHVHLVADLGAFQHLLRVHGLVLGVVGVLGSRTEEV